MRHVLGLQAHFPPPDYVITPIESESSSSNDKENNIQNNHHQKNNLDKNGQGKSGHCWAFPNQKGIISIQLSQPTYVTHISYQHVLSKEITSQLEMSAAPQFVHVIICQIYMYILVIYQLYLSIIYTYMPSNVFIKIVNLFGLYCFFSN